MIDTPLTRRTFLELASAACLFSPEQASAAESYTPGRIANDYATMSASERSALERPLMVSHLEQGSITVSIDGETKSLRNGESFRGWQLQAVVNMNGSATAVFEKHVEHAGAIVYVTEGEGVITRIRKGVGQLHNIRPRAISAPAGEFKRPTPFVPGPDKFGNYILNSNEDPCYENVAALGAEYIGYTLVANEESGPMRSLFLGPDGRSRQLSAAGENQGSWAPDLAGTLFDPSHLLPGEDPSVFEYKPGWSKRTLLHGYLPVANTGVWNPDSQAGYEVIVLLTNGENSSPMGRVRSRIPAWMAAKLRGAGTPSTGEDGHVYVERFWNTSPPAFYSALAGIANHWQHFFDDQMHLDIPDRWLADAARAGIVLSRCSYRGLRPTYQIGEGAYTKIPERSHALFPVAHYEFVWTQQLWNLTRQVDPYFNYYLDNYILPDGNFLYNTQDQVEAPLNTGIILWNSARAYDYTHDADQLKKRLPILGRMIQYMLDRYEYGKSAFAKEDRRHGLIWGSPEADLGDPQNDYPNSHPLYYQNSVWAWRGLTEHARMLLLAADESNMPEWRSEGAKLQAIAKEMREVFETSLTRTQAAANQQIRAAGISPFEPNDIKRDPKHLTSYENHRFMMDWFMADWGNASLDEGHLKHRQLAGQQILGLHTDAAVPRTSNFMEHGTLAARIREDDYRPFLLTLYSLCCYAADSGNRYAPEDAYLPGGHPQEGSPYGWSAVVNSVLQPTLGLRWLLCYEESNRDVCHLQKAAPKHWFAAAQVIAVEQCPTRFGHLSWRTESTGAGKWKVTLNFASVFKGDLLVHIHPPDGRKLRSASLGQIDGSAVRLSRNDLASKSTLTLDVVS